MHGTYKKNLESILQSGLKRMSRLHVHFSSGLPTDGEVISGMFSWFYYHYHYCYCPFFPTWLKRMWWASRVKVYRLYIANLCASCTHTIYNYALSMRFYLCVDFNSKLKFQVEKPHVFFVASREGIVCVFYQCSGECLVCRRSGFWILPEPFTLRKLIAQHSCYVLKDKSSTTVKVSY